MYTKCKYCEDNYNTIIEKLSIVKCNNCKLVFCKKKFTQEELTETYNQLYNKRVNSHYNVHTDIEYNKLKKGVIPKIGFNRKRIIDKYTTNKNVNILEIGSGIGLIASYIKNKGIENYLGLEIDYETYLKSQKLGLNTINTDFSYIERGEKEINIVMLWEVLEHLQDLKLFVNLIIKKLKKNGVLMFSVPNFDKIKNYKKNKQNGIYQDTPPIHLNFFTKESIKNILESSGFHIEYLYIKKRPYINFKSKHFYRMMYRVLRGKYEGSTIYVVARKIEA